MAPSSANKDMTLPKVLLWAHQLRKEHNSLLYRLDEVEKIARDAAAVAQENPPEAIDKTINSRLEEATKQAASVKDRVDKLQSQLEALSTQHSQEQITEASWRDQLKERVDMLESRFVEIGNHNTCLEQKLKDFFTLLQHQSNPESEVKKGRQSPTSQYQTTPKSNTP